MAAPNQRLPPVQDRALWLAQDMAYFDREEGLSPRPQQRNVMSTRGSRTPSFLQMFLDDQTSFIANPPPTPRISPRPLENSLGNSQEHRNYPFPIVDNLPPNVQFQNGQYRRDHPSDEDRQILREFFHTPSSLPYAVIGGEEMSRNLPPKNQLPRNPPPRNLPPRNPPPRNLAPNNPPTRPAPPLRIPPSMERMHLVSRNPPPNNLPPRALPTWQPPQQQQQEQQQPMVVCMPPPKERRNRKQREKYAAMTDEQKKERNRRRYEMAKAWRVKTQERKQLEALLLASNDIQHDTEAERAAVLRVRRGRWAKKARKHYQKMSPEERKEYNQKKLLRKIQRETGEICTDLTAEDQPQAVVDYLDKLRKEHNARQLARYHALTADKKKERNKKEPGQRKKKPPKPKPVIPDCVLQVIEELRSQAVDTAVDDRSQSVEKDVETAVEATVDDRSQSVETAVDDEQQQ